MVNRNAAKCALLVRNDMRLLDISVTDKLKRQGLAFNAVDNVPMRARLGPYYAKWKSELGTPVWSRLEETAGKLG